MDVASLTEFPLVNGSGISNLQENRTAQTRAEFLECASMQRHPRNRGHSSNRSWVPCAFEERLVLLNVTGVATHSVVGGLLY